MFINITSLSLYFTKLHFAPTAVELIALNHNISPHFELFIKMYSRIKYIVAGVALLLFLLIGCSTKKNTSAIRAYHELTTRYNIFFNAQEMYNQQLENELNNFSDDYSELLPIYPRKQNMEKTQPGGAFDGVIEKTEKAIKEHSLSVKPRRDAEQMQSQEYRDWLRQEEFNPFIKNVWLLMGKAHLQNGDYERALEVFRQTINLFKNDTEVVSEAEIWMTRAYIEANQLHHAQSLITALQVRSLSKELKSLFAETQAYFLIRQERYAEAAPYLREVINSEKNATQKKRLQFLLGQLYALSDEKEEAFLAFENVKGLSTPHHFSLNATVLQADVATGSQWQKTLSELEKMTKNGKNKEYLDKIYFAVGNMHLQQNDTTKALKSYLLAEKNATTESKEKALAQIALSDIYFNRKVFPKAEPGYSSAIKILPEKNPSFKRASFRSRALQELVPHIVKVEEQDSIRNLANLPHDEKMKIINARIAEVKKSERAAEREQYLSEQQADLTRLSTKQAPTTAEAAFSLSTRTGDSEFYFDNPQVVLQGRAEFQKQWGNRPLADNWRLFALSNAFSPALAETPESSDAPAEQAETDSPSRETNPLSPNYYLQQLPTTPEAIAASDKIIEEGLWNMGSIAATTLRDYDYAIAAYNRLLRDFPKGEHTPDVYFRLYALHHQNGNIDLAESFKQKLLLEYPENENSMTVREIDFSTDASRFVQMQDSLYQKAYQAYKKGELEQVHIAYEEFQKKYPNSDFLPGIALLNALSYAQKGDTEKAETYLKELLGAFPESEESLMAQNIIDGISAGKIPVSTPVVGTAFSRLAADDSSLPAVSEQDTLRFNIDKTITHVVLLPVSASSADKNKLLFATANFNFSNFQLRAFQLSFMSLPDTEILQVKQFPSHREAALYVGMMQADILFKEQIPNGVAPVIISEENLELLRWNKSLDEYAVFYSDSLNEVLPEIVPSEEKEEVLPIKIEEIKVSEPEKIVPLETEKTTIDSRELPMPKIEKQTAAQKQAELERKASELLRREQEAEPEKSREEILKERERERKEKIRKRNEELKERQKAREEQLKQRDREREQKLREQKRIRDENLKKRERITRERNR